MSKKIVILALHLGTGGAEKVICNLANLLSENNNVKIISTYKLNEKPSFKINDNVEIEYLIKNLKPNKQELKNSLKNFNLICAIKEIITTFKVLYLRKSLMINAIKNLDCDRLTFSKYYKAMLNGKSYLNKEICFEDIKEKESNFAQFVFCLLVFKELGIIKQEQDFLLVSTGEKNELVNSKIYKFIQSLKF